MKGNHSSYRESGIIGQVSKRKKLAKPIGIKRRSSRQILEMVTAYIMENHVDPPGRWTAEAISRYTKVPVHQINHALHILNREGLISQGMNSGPHDSPRDIMCTGSWSAWRATSYGLIKRDVPAGWHRHRFGKLRRNRR